MNGIVRHKLFGIALAAALLFCLFGMFAAFAAPQAEACFISVCGCTHNCGYDCGCYCCSSGGSTGGGSTTTAYVTIYYSPNNGVGNPFSETVSTKTTYIIKNCGYTKPGMLFDYYSTNPNGTGDLYWVGDAMWNMPAWTITLYAHYKPDPNYVDITYNPNGGNGTVVTDNVKKGTSYAIRLLNYTKSGMTFNGWNTKPDGTGVAYATNQTITVNGALTLYAQWKPVVTNVTVTYNPNGGTGSAATDTVPVNSSYTVKTQNYTRPGMDFNGWNTKSDGTGVAYAVGQTVTVSADLTLYAQWKTANVTVTYNPNGGTGNVATDTVAVNSSYTIKSQNYTRPGMNFTGWNTKTDGTGVAYTVGQTITVSADLTLYAQWTTANVTVTYNPNGGTGNVATDTVAVNSSYTIKSQNYTRPGMNFTGWNTKTDGTGVSYTPGQTVTVTADLTLYAQWTTANVTVTYNPNGGTGNVATDTVAANSSYTVKSQNYTKTGMTFNGWNTKADGTGVAYTVGQTITVTADLTLYAQWQAENPTVKTGDANDVTDNQATINNNTYTGVICTVTAAGVQYNTSSSVAGATTVYSATKGSPFNVPLTGLQPNTTYYYRAVLVTTCGTYYGEIKTFKTAPVALINGEVTKRSNVSTVAVGDSFVYTFTATNKETARTWENVTVTDTLPGQVTYVSATGDGTVTNNNGTLTISFGSIAANSSKTVNITVKVNASAQAGVVIRNSATVNSGNGDCGKVITDSNPPTVTCPTVTYDPNGGTGSQVTENVALNSSYTIKSQNYTRTGMTFTGWNTKADGTGVSYTVGQTITMTGSLTLYAQWTVVCTTTVTYDPNGGTGSQVTDNANLNSSYTIKSQNYTKTGMVFNGWNTNANGSGTAYTVGQTVTLTSSLTLYAQWKAEAGNITVVTGDPTNITSGGATINNNTYTNVNCTITKVGVQYSTNANLSSPTSVYGTNGSPFSVGLTGLQPSTTYYYRAVVASSCGNSFGAIKSFTTPSGTVPTVTVAYNPNGGVGQSVTENTPANSNYTVKSQGYTKAGMTFTGWNTKPDGTGVAYGVGQTIQLTGSITLYAQWCASCGDVVVTTGSVSMNGTNKFTVNGNSYSGNVGTVSSVGVQYSTDPNMVNGITSVGGTVITSPFNSVQITVTPGAAYYFRAYIVTSGGTFYGNIVGTWI